MLETLTYDLCAAQLNSNFRIYLNDQVWVDAELIEASERPPRVGRAAWAMQPVRTPFSLIFRGPMTPMLPQQMYRVEHEVLGRVDGLFLVPVGHSPEGLFYEAVFS